MTNKPIVYYKYHKINEILSNLLRNRTIWFSSQNNLNDPYDCKYSLSDEYFMSLIQQSVAELFKDLKKSIPQMTEISEERFIEIVLPTIRNEEWINGFHNILFNEGLGWCVCCFSEDSLNELMWAHYADSYNGVCLEFDLSKTPYLHEKIFPVTYKDNLPIINSMDELPGALLTKRKVWSYEKEWRILSNVKGTKTFEIDSLTSIIFGYKVKKEVIDSIRTLMIESGYTNVKFKKLGYYVNNIKYKEIENFPFGNSIS